MSRGFQALVKSQPTSPSLMTKSSSLRSMKTLETFLEETLDWIHRSDSPFKVSWSNELNRQGHRNESEWWM